MENTRKKVSIWCSEGFKTVIGKPRGLDSSAAYLLLKHENILSDDLNSPSNPIITFIDNYADGSHYVMDILGKRAPDDNSLLLENDVIILEYCPMLAASKDITLDNIVLMLKDNGLIYVPMSPLTQTYGPFKENANLDHRPHTLKYIKTVQIEKKVKFTDLARPAFFMVFQKTTSQISSGGRKLPKQHQYIKTDYKHKDEKGVVRCLYAKNTHKGISKSRYIKVKEQSGKFTYKRVSNPKI